jgi:hypothetical protein
VACCPGRRLAIFLLACPRHIAYTLLITGAVRRPDLGRHTGLHGTGRCTLSQPFGPPARILFAHHCTKKPLDVPTPAHNKKTDSKRERERETTGAAAAPPAVGHRRRPARCGPLGPGTAGAALALPAWIGAPPVDARPRLQAVRPFGRSANLIGGLLHYVGVSAAAHDLGTMARGASTHLSLHSFAVLRPRLRRARRLAPGGWASPGRGGARAGVAQGRSLYSHAPAMFRGALAGDRRTGGAKAASHMRGAPSLSWWLRAPSLCAAAGPGPRLGIAARAAGGAPLPDSSLARLPRLGTAAASGAAPSVLPGLRKHNKPSPVLGCNLSARPHTRAANPLHLALRCFCQRSACPELAVPNLCPRQPPSPCLGTAPALS